MADFFVARSALALVKADGGASVYSEEE